MDARIRWSWQPRLILRNRSSLGRSRVRAMKRVSGSQDICTAVAEGVEGEARALVDVADIAGAADLRLWITVQHLVEIDKQTALDDLVSGRTADYISAGRFLMQDIDVPWEMKNSCAA